MKFNIANSYPLSLDLRGKEVLVVGAGPAVLRRVEDLIEVGAVVKIVAESAVDEILSLKEAGKLELLIRAFHENDISGNWLVITATGDEAIDRKVLELATKEKIFTQVMSDASLSSAWRPAVTKRGDHVQVAVNTDGDPKKAVAIRDAINLALDLGTLPVRSHRKSGIGKVYLVGGGPGITGLLTLRARQLLNEADVIVVDNLAPREILSELPEEIEIIDCGKSSGNHKLTQDQINATIVERAKRGSIVVRLKGGDPYVLGRGSEEFLACKEAGIECEVVPGITSAISVPLSAGIPVTHRGVAQGFAVYNGHDNDELTNLDPKITYVFLMGVEYLEKIVAKFIEGSWSHETPVAVIEQGWRPDQRTTVGTLGNIIALKEEIEFKAPAIVVIGDVVSLHKELMNEFA